MIKQDKKVIRIHYFSYFVEITVWEMTSDHLTYDINTKFSMAARLELPSSVTAVIWSHYVYRLSVRLTTCQILVNAGCQKCLEGISCFCTNVHMYSRMNWLQFGGQIRGNWPPQWTTADCLLLHRSQQNVPLHLRMEDGACDILQSRVWHTVHQWQLSLWLTNHLTWTVH